ncbi:signal recognition particle-docking protein FtsY [Nocardia sp. BMG111209]|uniref:signal recognition particle-docking protein FtsY n=1 Tax=Nocardia sp. BMG111209 TaxID=1160137 RepID=UPI000365D6F7|nr:signal recognition particle-docking protein FtsY [Nocardia sp. BMG111209]
MTAQAWILIAAIVAVLVVALVVAGFVRYKRRRVTLTPAAPVAEVTDRSGGYTAAGGFSFSQGGAKPEPVAVPGERTDDEGQPHIGDDAAVPRDSARRSITDVRLPEPGLSAEDAASIQEPEPAARAEQAAALAAVAGAEQKHAVTPEADDAVTPETDDSAVSGPVGTETSGNGDGSVTTEGPATVAGAAAVDRATGGETADRAATEGSATDRAATEDSAADRVTAEGSATDAATPTAPATDRATAEEAAAAAAEQVAAAAAATTAPAPAPVPTAPTAPLEEIEPTAGRLTRLRGRLSRSQNAVGKSLLGLLGGGDLDEDSWEEIEDTLVMADLGAAVTATIVDRLREQMASRSVRTTDQARAVLREVLVGALRPELDRSIKALPHADHPSILLVVGVNGTGKTTTTGKLARVLIADGRRVLLGAADTFRAAAADQLQTWGERVGAETVRGREGADPASVAFDAVSTGIAQGVDAVLVDTAGRLHTKTGLMDELGKVKRVVEKKAAVDEVLLVLDATVGQNGLTQARVFAEVVDITGVVLTKLDGTAKGGIVFQVQHELGVPVKLVGLGEGADDLAPFEPGAFVDALLG